MCKFARPFVNLLFIVLCFACIETASQAQVGLAVNSYFGVSNTNLAFCQARTIVTGASVQGAVNFGAPQGSIAIQVTTLTTEKVISGSTSTNYAILSGWGYWIPTGSKQTIPCLVKAEMSQSSAGLATIAVQVTNYVTGALVYSSGTLQKTGQNVIAIGVVTPPVIAPPAGGGSGATPAVSAPSTAPTASTHK